MTTKENPAPRANAVSRAISKSERGDNKPSAADLEAQAAALWLAARSSIPATLARVWRLAAIAGAFR